MIITLYQFRQRFTPAEKRRIYAAAESVMDIRIYLDDLASVGERGVNLALEATQNGVLTLGAGGLLDHPGRPAEILASDGTDGGDAEQIALATGQPCVHDANWTVVEGGTFDASTIVEVVNTQDTAQKVGYSARFIATGEN